ncbi:spermatogenesis-associated protein [Coniochaeta ligniaria NRRL 30616]|uniref:Spermatogenesis-associated protein n=1 Tax=Coniochaeta ligniaria NRRL 30616 TaxID=1408157 RepID=A0A1J7IUG2_9PEZI|nr:spermatogenesis-associated protein [Coniochaeta ligniaria NRRL 30616]
MSSQHSHSPAGTAAPSISNLSLGAAEQRANEKSLELGHQQHAQQAAAAGTASHGGGGGEMHNRAPKSNSPYIRSHTTSPVHWQLLDDEAVSRARRENKLIFLNVGFRACHYCRLTAQDSFSSPQVASLLNTSFVPIVVDREERPDIDAIYMNYIQAVNGDGGWPLNIFLTPELEPVFGGTYWPGPGTELITGTESQDSTAGDEERLDFLVVLQKLDKVWREQETRCRKEAGEILLQLREFAAEGTLGARAIGTPAGGGTNSAAMGASPATADLVANLGSVNLTSAAAPDLDLDLDQLEEAYAHIAGTFDAVNGGFGAPAPKFPTPPKLSFLLKLGEFPGAVADVVGEKEVARARDMATFTLRKIRDGGLRDHVGGGFARYSVTADWAVPHFEKMVADNALLLGVYLDAWLGERKKGVESDFLDVVVELGDYLTSKPILTEGGAFASSEAADSYYKKGDKHVREGAYYLWTRREFDSVVGEESSVAAAHWNVLQHGNVPRDLDPQDEFINQNVLCVKKDIGELSRQFGIPVDEVKRMIKSAKEKLLAHREKERVRPETDGKVVAAYNGMVISALARTGRALREIDGEKAERYIAAATGAARFVKEKLWDAEGKVLYRSFHETKSETRAFADDYAFLIEGLLDVAEATGEEELIAWADELQSQYFLSSWPLFSPPHANNCTETQLDLFYDPPVSSPPTPMLHRSSSGGFYSTEESAAFTILRLKDGMDTAQPSTNGLSAANLFRLAALLNDKTYSARARETINAFEVEILQYPWLFVGLLGAVVTARLGVAGPVVSISREDKGPSGTE